MTPSMLFGLCGIVLFMMGLLFTLLEKAPLRRILAINIMGNGVFMLLIATAYDEGGADPVPQALVLTGIVVAVSATALALKLTCLVHEQDAASRRNAS